MLNRLAFLLPAVLVVGCVTEPADGSDPSDAVDDPAYALRRTAAACDIQFNYAVLNSSFEVTMPENHDVMIALSSDQFGDPVIQTAYNCGAWTPQAFQNQQLGCLREPGQPATQTIRVADHERFEREPADTVAASLAAIITAHTVDANGDEQEETIFSNSEPITCLKN